MELLPMIPQHFRVKLIENEGSKKQFHVLEELIKKADEIINCGDAGQEGELIQRWVLHKAGNNKPVKRLWISSLTDEAIKTGFKKLYPSSDFDNLYAAGSARAIGDWLLGLNATRACTVKYGARGQILSIGRVQTPTLAMLVERQKQIDNFVPQDFWELKTNYRGGIFNLVRGRFLDEEEAGKWLAAIEGTQFEIVGVEKKKSKEHPPKLFDLTSLQVECNKKYGFSAEETLSYIQNLYEKKLTTYPRVDTVFLPNDQYPKAGQVLQGLTPYSNFIQPLLEGGSLRKSSKVFNDKKITDHHAIIPTGEWGSTAASLPVNEKRVLDMVVRRYIAIFYPDCEIANTTVMGRALVERTAAIEEMLKASKKAGESNSDEDDFTFKATGKQVLNPTWRVLFEKPADVASASNITVNTGTAANAAATAENADKTADSDKEISEEENVLPDYRKGESGTHEPSLKKGKTSPPKRMTEGDLLRAMETAGKQIEDEELREAMKENGIGRPSTRAAIIETLFKRGYIVKDKKDIVPTPLGIQLIDTVKNPLLKSAELTGQWEKKLRLISDGKYSVQTFMNELKAMTTDVVKHL
jgi:DNA topoisomerase-3